MIVVDEVPIDFLFTAHMPKTTAISFWIVLLPDEAGGSWRGKRAAGLVRTESVRPNVAHTTDTARTFVVRLLLKETPGHPGVSSRTVYSSITT